MELKWSKLLRKCVQLNKPNQKSDSSLIRSIRAGDEAAANDLFERYIRRLDSLAGKGLAHELSGRLDSNDITQSVFRTFFRRVSNGQYQIPPGETIWKLLAVIALNKIRTVGAYHRAAKRDVRRSSSVSDVTTLGKAVGQDEEALRILHLTIAEVIGNLPETQQKIIQLRLEEHDIATIAQQVGRSKRTVERVLHGFRSDLQRSIDEEATNR